MRSTELELWASSGAMSLTGRDGGAPLASPGAPATAMVVDLHRFREASRTRIGRSPVTPGVELLAERAAYADLKRQGPVSCNGSFRAFSTLDGQVGFSLARDYDLRVLPALTSKPDASGWDDLIAWAAARMTCEVVERGRLLDMALAPIPDQDSPVAGRPPVVVTRGAQKRVPERPRIVDMTSLWAGPLCAHLLGHAEADVVKIESKRRPDGARSGNPGFFRSLHARSSVMRLDLTDGGDLKTLRRLIASADLVLEASRPRALAALGISAEEAVDTGTSWLSITARGRSSNSIGFGDDVAVGAGLFCRDQGEVLTCGDAIADPLTGARAAAEAASALLLPHATLVDISMHDVARHAAAGQPEPHATVLRDDHWWVESASGEFPVALPRAHRC